MGVTGIDKTGAAFNSIRNRARRTGAQIRSIMGGAIAAAGAYLGVRSIKGAVDELGKLSDLAMKSGTSVEELTKSATAFQIAGLDLSVESLARSFQYMRKQTGEGGLDNFYKIASSIASIEDPAKRGAELVKNFGRAGLELQPLISGGEEAIEKMRMLTEVMPGVSTAAANAGDAAADSLTALGKGAQSVMLRAVGKIISLWSDDFPGGIRAGALSAANWLEYFARKSMATVTKWGHNIGAALGWWQMLFTEGYDRANEVFAAVTDEYKLAVHLLDTDEFYVTATDPWDVDNRIADPSVAEARNALHDELMDWMNRTRDPFRGYQWICRPWREDKTPSWDVDGFTRQRESDPGEYRQLDYSTGLPMEEATRKK
jgi:hypothetical protein